jgi:hypothetical protein
MCGQRGVVAAQIEAPEWRFVRVGGGFSAAAYTQRSSLLTDCLVYRLKQVGRRKWF